MVRKAGSVDGEEEGEEADVASKAGWPWWWPWCRDAAANSSSRGARSIG